MVFSFIFMFNFFPCRIFIMSLCFKIYLFSLQNFPALVLKIMQGANATAPLSDNYSSSLCSLVHAMLLRNPDDRPNVESIMANPVVVNALVNLGTDVGRLPCAT